MTDQAEGERKKRPASQYYWGDWWKDKGLHSCSLTARGLWHEMNCLMHEGEPYGHLTLNGRAMSVAQLANQCRISAPQCSKLLRELEDAGVPSKTPEGIIFSRRMVRDEAVRNSRAAGGKEGAEHGSKGAEHGSKGGRPAQPKGGLETPLDDRNKPPPSSSSSSSPSGISEAEASGAKPPADKAKAELWKAAVSLLSAQGMPEPQARALFGKLAKDYPDGDTVLQAVQAAISEQPADARAYLKATCQRLAGERKRDGGLDWTASAK